MSEFIYVELANANISRDVIQQFDCKHPDFNDFLYDEAVKASANGEGVTYVLVDKEEYEIKQISVIFAFATIQSMALTYYDIDEKDNYLYNMSCVEIKYFAIRKQVQKVIAYDIDMDKYFSTIFFEIFLQNLYEMSTKLIGFQTIFLRANENGKKLYKRKGFINAEKYIIPYEDSDPNGKCTPMVLLIADNLAEIFI